MESYFYALIVVAIVVGAICKYYKINPAMPLIAAGLVIEFLLPDLIDSLPDPEVILTLVLAPLVFAAGLASSALDLRKVRRSVLLLAVGLVIITTAVVGVVASIAVGVLTLATACALGAILAPTDAVAASIVAKRSGLPRRVSLIIEGESLANDGTALTILRVAVVAAVAGSVTVMQSVGILAAAVIGGILVGVAGGFIVGWVMRRAHEPMVANAILLVTPFMLYQVSEHIGGSGLLTLVIAGVWISHTTAIRASYKTRLQAGTIWSLITFVLESFAFVLVGAEFFDTYSRVQQPSPPMLALWAIAITLLIMVIRSLFMAAWLAVGPKVRPDKYEDRRRVSREFIAIGLLGVRGPVSVLAAFSLPLTVADGSPFPGRDLILCLTFGVVIVSLLSSMLATPLLRRLDFGKRTSDARRIADSRHALAQAALNRLDELIVQADHEDQPIDPVVVNELRGVAIRRLDQAVSSPDSQSSGQLMARNELRREMVHAEREELARLRKEENIPGDVLNTLTKDLDVREQALGRMGPA